MSVLVAVRAKDVQAGDEIDLSNYTVEAVVTGQNGQVYVFCKFAGGGTVTFERDPDEIVSVRR